MKNKYRYFICTDINQAIQFDLATGKGYWRHESPKGSKRTLKDNAPSTLGIEHFIIWKHKEVGRTSFFKQLKEWQGKGF